MAGTWTTARVDLLRALWADGVPAGVIGKRLGVTRGMVAGKRHSLGLPCRTGEVRQEAERRNGQRTAALRGHAGKADSVADAAKAAAVVGLLAAMARPLAGSSPRPWMMRAFGECAFPVTGYGAETLSCCLPIEPGCGYCLGHREFIAGRPWPPEDAAPELAATQWVDA